ncbi:MAG: nucleotidyltransferase domain-containing protein [Bacteroidales bacterium]|nr:nucleotidyltransferase domain-containing protein [Bacteroidales bacterium]
MNNKLIIKELKDLLIENFRNTISDVVLFGSQHKGTATKDSDVDVIIVLKKEYDWKMKRKINDLCYEIDLKYDIFLDTQIISLNELKNSIRGKHPIFFNALKEGYYA